jgi:putative PIN family toxin of toxin-antitoxin system
VAKVVLDTNVVVSAVISTKGAPRQILQAWYDQRFDLVTAPALIAELARALRYDRVMRRYRISEEDIRSTLALLWTQAEVISDPETVEDITSDRADNVVLAVCRQAQADLLVTGDRRLLELADHYSTRVISPRDFLGTLS